MMMITIPAVPAFAALVVLVVSSWIWIVNNYDLIIIPIQIALVITAYFVTFGLLAAAGV